MPSIGETKQLGSRTFTYNGKEWKISNTGATLPAITTPSSAPQSTVSSPSPTPIAATPFARDFAREQAYIKSIGASPEQLGMLDPKGLYEGVYKKEELAGLSNYQKILQKEQAQADLSATQRPTQSMLRVLENALRAKSDVGRQKLGRSQYDAQFGIPTEGVSAYSTLISSMQQRGNEMKDRYGSFVNQLSTVSGALSDQYQLASDRYKLLNDEYSKETERMQKVVDGIIQQEREFELLEKKSNIYKEDAKYARDLEIGTYDKTNIDKNTSKWENGELRSSQTSDLRNMSTVTTRDPNGDNCVLFQRAEGAIMPYGLYTKEDKQNAVAKAGSTDMNNVQIGDVIATGEGKYGHVAKVVGMNGDNLVLKEANYKAGQVTQGRQINKNDRSILGFFEQSGRTANYPQVKVGEDVGREGYNPAIEDQFLASSEGAKDVSQLSPLAQQIYRGEASMDDLTPSELTKIKKEIASAGLVLKNLSTNDKNRIDKIVGQWDSEPIVKNYNVIAEGYNFVKNLSDTTDNPSDDQALIYSFAKVMDPNSVVREGEYATVQKYAQSWLQSFGFNAIRVVNNGEFLTVEARKNMKKTLRAKFEASRNEYENTFEEYGRRIDKITEVGGEEYLTDYSKANAETAQENEYPKGTILEVNGERYISNGDGTFNQL